MKIINLKLNGKTAYFELFEEEAPITSQRLLEILPVKMDIHYAKFAGQEVFGVVPMMAPIEGGKSLKEIDRGCVAFYPDRAFFCIYYGDLQDEEVSITVIGQLYADDDFIAEMEKCRYRQGDVMEIWDPDSDKTEFMDYKFMVDTKLGWDKLPEDIKRVYMKRGIALPGGPIINSDGESRKLADFIYTLYTSVKNGESYDLGFAGKLLDYYAFKIGGWCGMTDCADDITKYKELLLAPGADLEAILVDFIYYVNKMSMWIDLLIPWEDITDLMRRPDDRDFI
jgi:hypothetical protein